MTNTMSIPTGYVLAPGGDIITKADYLARINDEMVRCGIKPAKTLSDARRAKNVSTGSAPTNSPSERKPVATSGLVGGTGKPATFASDAQKNFVRNLYRQLDMTDAYTLAQVDTLTKAQAHTLIDNLLKRVKAAKDATVVNVPTATITVTASAPTVTTVAPLVPGIYTSPLVPAPAIVSEPGIYIDGETVYKVAISRTSGRPYALIREGRKFTYAPGHIGKLTADMLASEDDLIAYGRTYHTCADCGRRLTNPVSIAAGRGPKHR